MISPRSFHYRPISHIATDFFLFFFFNRQTFGFKSTNPTHYIIWLNMYIFLTKRTQKVKVIDEKVTKKIWKNTRLYRKEKNHKFLIQNTFILPHYSYRYLRYRKRKLNFFCNIITDNGYDFSSHFFPFFRYLEKNPWCLSFEREFKEWRLKFFLFL